ncbi:hypothetical protein [Evansella clarkii]|uniref:hypothetical protein n=1 Tax=Evansella clarkii TaxID=79879 RepID=UPI001C489E86|nr:hypothetical protein [Evansella clarkii]
MKKLVFGSEVFDISAKKLFYRRSRRFYRRKIHFIGETASLIGDPPINTSLAGDPPLSLSDKTMLEAS